MTNSASDYRPRLPHRGEKIAPRKCLRCQKPFRSKGNWNRVCPRCSETNASIVQNHVIDHRGGLPRTHLGRPSE